MTGGLEAKGTGRSDELSPDARATIQAGFSHGDLAADNWSVASQFDSPAGKRARSRVTHLSNKVSMRIDSVELFNWPGVRTALAA
jgi:hypothetical protein